MEALCLTGEARDADLEVPFRVGDNLGIAGTVGGFNRTMVLDNDTVFGTVNANRGHYEAAVAALQRADKSWLDRLITRRVPVEQWTLSLAQEPDDIKVVVDFS